jgi:hypothetical protein
MFTDKFIQRPVMATCLNILLFVIGLVALISLPVRQYPQTRSTVITVTTQFPGAAADLVQGFVTQPLQQALANVPGVDYITSASKLGTSTITVYMQLNQSPDAAVANVVAQVQSVKYQLPQGVYDPAITISTGETLSVIYVAFYSETLNAQQITDYVARVIQPAFATVSGVAAANIRGQQNVAIRIWLNPQRMALYNLSAQQVQQALTINNRLTPAGQIRGYFALFDVDARTLLSDPEEFRNLIIATRDGDVIRLRDIAEVIAARQEKTLIFTQFKEITAPLAAFLGTVFGRAGLVLHGGTEVKKRKVLVRQFQEDDSIPFFILSVKAGGTGLNLTAASHVIHFDRWWNPAVESQATDRAFRIGQTRNVLVHKFVCRGTVEDKIDQMIEAKQQLAGDFLSGGYDIMLTEMKDEELLKVVTLDLSAAIKEG